MNLAEKKAYIWNMDFSQMLEKLINTKFPHPYAYLWEKDAATKAIEKYRKFLFIQAKYRHDFEYIPPTLELDEIWHNHILETKRYHKDCDILFGEYFHHYPYFGLDNPEKPGADFKTLGNALAITSKLFLIEFQELLTEPKIDEVFKELGLKNLSEKEKREKLFS